MGRRKDLTGQKFGRLTVIEETPKRNSCGHIIWKCQCDCENVSEVAGAYLTNGKILSCGCARKENSAKATSKDLEDLLLNTSKYRVGDNWWLV